MLALTGIHHFNASDHTVATGCNLTTTQSHNSGQVHTLTQAKIAAHAVDRTSVRANIAAAANAADHTFNWAHKLASANNHTTSLVHSCWTNDVQTASRTTRRARGGLARVTMNCRNDDPGACDAFHTWAVPSRMQKCTLLSPPSCLHRPLLSYPCLLLHPSLSHLHPSHRL